MFFQPPFLVPKPPRARFPNPRSKFWIRGPKMDLRGQKPKRCAPKNHAENWSRNWKWSHMVQVMAKNHSGANQAKPSLDLETSWALNHRPCASNRAKVSTLGILKRIKRIDPELGHGRHFPPQVLALEARMTAVNQLPQMRVPI